MRLDDYHIHVDHLYSHFECDVFHVTYNDCFCDSTIPNPCLVLELEAEAEAPQEADSKRPVADADGSYEPPFGHVPVTFVSSFSVAMASMLAAATDMKLNTSPLSLSANRYRSKFKTASSTRLPI
jgi:hypothetical protein